MSTRTTIPLFPLGVVLYPQGLLPLKIFEQRYMEMTKACIRDNTPFGICLIRSGHEVGTPALPYESGCTTRILHWDMPQIGMFHLRTQGELRFRIVKQWSDSIGLLHGEVELTPMPKAVAVPAQHQKLVTLLQDVMPKVGVEHFPVPQQLNDAAWVGYRLLEVLPFSNPVKQELLEQDDSLARLQFIAEFLEANQIVL
jgi:Lon protease-like protein